MGLIYRMLDWDGHTKNSPRRNKYYDDEKVTKVKTVEFKIFDGRENSREREETMVDSWSHDDPSMPDWLRDWLG